MQGWQENCKKFHIFSYHCLQTNDYYQIKIPSWNLIILYKILILDRNTWNDTTSCELFVLDRNTWNDTT